MIYVGEWEKSTPPFSMEEFVVQLRPEAAESFRRLELFERQEIWDSTRQNEVRNKDGFIVCQDKRATLHGWGPVSAASPIVIGKYFYAPTMIGMVYVLRPSLECRGALSKCALGVLRGWKVPSYSTLAQSAASRWARCRPCTRRRCVVCRGSSPTKAPGLRDR